MKYLYLSHVLRGMKAYTALKISSVIAISVLIVFAISVYFGPTKKPERNLFGNEKPTTLIVLRSF